MKPENVKCPKCNGDMVSRKSARGPFWGCKSYPQCNGTRDVNGDSLEERHRKMYKEDKEDIGPDSYNWNRKRE